MHWIQFPPLTPLPCPMTGAIGSIGSKRRCAVGIPGLRRLDHVGFTVPDLDAAQKFLVEVLGCEYLYSLGPYADESSWMADHLNVHPRATIPENRFFRLGDQVIFEVFRYAAPDQRSEPPRNSDVGGHHVALYVD